ncbi:MAG: hypothetical protein JSV49_09990 [Thermoplasmata archaeon]|nr:MAG: hypothetical protein JSV49_09990 [Thermoplasmata archaeon]
MVYGRKYYPEKNLVSNRSKKISKDRSGGLEGMPLQLLIIVVIAVMALGIIMYWMSSVNEPPKSIKTIGVEVDGNEEDIDLSKGQPRTIKITVYDTELKKLDGALVILDGCGFDQDSEKTGDNGFESGSAEFDGSLVELPPGIKTGEIKVTVKKADYATKTTTILVYTS